MLHKYLPRVGAGVLAFAAAACGDSTGPRPAGPRLVLAFETAASDTIGQFGVGVTAALSDSATLRGLRLYVDSARSPAPAATNHDLYNVGGRQLRAVAFLPGPGRYTITAAVTDTLGRVVSTSFTRTVALDSAAYTVTPLPDLGGGATATWVHANGTVVGDVTTPQGRVRPAMWRNGQLAIPAVTDSADASAVRVNAAGDLLVAYGSTPDTSFLRARVLRADGAALTFGAWLGRFAVAADLADDRRALAYWGDGTIGGQSATLDVAAGRVVDSAATPLMLLNSAGQAVGVRRGAPPYSSGLVTHGFAAAEFPTEPQANACANHEHNPVPGGLDDDGNLLVRLCRNVAFLSARGSVWLDRYVGPAAAATARLSRQGGLVAALDSTTGAVYLWRADSRRAARLRVGGWRVDRIGGVNAGGVIAAHGVEAGTGRGAALLLSPAAP